MVENVKVVLGVGIAKQLHAVEIWAAAKAPTQVGTGLPPTVTEAAVDAADLEADMVVEAFVVVVGALFPRPRFLLAADNTQVVMLVTLH